MTTQSATLANPPHLRPIPPRHPIRQVWDRVGWNVALVIEIAVVIVVLEFLINVVGLWNPAFVPPPTDIAESFNRLASRGVLASNVAFSLTNFAIGFLMAAVAGILIGLLLGTSRLFKTLVGSLVWIAYSTPRVALAPLFVMWLGFGAESKIAVIFLMAIFPIIINVWVGAESVDQTLLRAGSVFGASRVDQYRKVILPYILPYTLTGLRLGIARGLVGVVVAEFIGSAAGIGYLIKLLSSEFDLAAALALTLILMLTANASMILLDVLRRRVAPWYKEGSY
jgi:ABC-type nitrate/sulfonate/bicarbonate transport system permease component